MKEQSYRLKCSNIRRQQQQEETQPHLEALTEVDSEYNSPEEKKSRLSPNILRR